MTDGDTESGSWWSRRPRWQKIGLVSLAVIVVLAVVSNLGDTDETSDNGTGEATGAELEGTTSSPSSSVSECEAAFADAAAVGDLEDVIEDLYPAVRACLTIEEWSAASDVHRDALDGADPLVFLSNVCSFAEEPDIQASPLCQLIES